LGDTITDEISFLGRVGDLGIIPINNSSANLGASGNQWNTLWIDTLQNASTVVVSSPNFAINSSQITLGDATTDDISFLGQVDTNIVIEEIAEPGNAPVNTGRFYAKESGGVSVPFWKDEAGTETSMIGAASGANTALSNLIATSINQDLDPDGDNTRDLGSSGLEWANIWVTTLQNNGTIAVTSPTFSINSATINLGDQTSDNINFLGQVSTNIVLEEITEPGNAPANTGRFYAKVDGGVSVPFWKDEAGTESNMIAAGAAGANTALSNLVSVAINTSLLPNADGTLNLGSAANSWLDTFTERLRIETGGASTSTANQIIADGGGMIFNTPAGDRYEFNISGSPNGIAIEEDRIQFLTGGRQHRIDVGGTSITIVSENTNDSIDLFPGAGRSNEAVRVQNLQTKFSNNTSASRYEVQLVYTNAVTTGQPAIGNIGFMADSSLNVESAYAGIVTAIDSDVSTARDGRMQIVVANADGAGAAGIGQLTGIGMDIQSDAGVMKLGFFGVAPVARQSPAANSAAIISALEALGLFV